MFKSCSDYIVTKMSFGNVKCVAVRKRISDEIPMIINVFLSLSFASDFEERVNIRSCWVGNVGSTKGLFALNWGFLMAYLLHKKHAQKSPWCECSNFINWWLSTKVQDVWWMRVLEQTNMELRMHDHSVCHKSKFWTCSQIVDDLPTSYLELLPIWT
jgi:hypothetical protein